jgi:phage shock protein E
VRAKSFTFFCFYAVKFVTYPYTPAKYSHMKSLIYYITCLTLLTLCACKQAGPEQTSLAAESFQAAIQKQPGILLDVRTPEEYAEGHLPAARNLDYKSESFKDSLQTLDKNKPYYIYCKSGVRSGKAADMMKEMGFTQVYNMEGGIDAWKKEGRPLSN